MSEDFHFLQVQSLIGGHILFVDSAETLRLACEWGVGIVVPDSSFIDDNCRRIIQAKEPRPFVELAEVDELSDEFKDCPEPFYFLDANNLSGHDLSRVFIRARHASEISAEVLTGVAVVVADVDTLRAVKSLRQNGDLTPIFAEVSSFDEALALFKEGVDASVIRFRTDEVQIAALSNALVDGIAPLPLASENSVKLGIIALQGEFRLQAKRFRDAIDRSQYEAVQELEPMFVTCPEHVKDCKALVLVGGWSNLQTKLLEQRRLIGPVQQFKTDGGYLLGLCAGMILCRSRDGKVCDDRLKLSLVDMRIDNNVLNHAIRTRLTEGTPERFSGADNWIPDDETPLFSEGPVIVEHGDSVQPLAITRDGHVVGAREERVMVMAYHNGPSVHDMFLEFMMEVWPDFDAREHP